MAATRHNYVGGGDTCIDEAWEMGASLHETTYILHLCITCVQGIWMLTLHVQRDMYEWNTPIFGSEWNPDRALSDGGPVWALGERVLRGTRDWFEQHHFFKRQAIDIRISFIEQQLSSPARREPIVLQHRSSVDYYEYVVFQHRLSTATTTNRYSTSRIYIVTIQV